MRKIYAILTVLLLTPALWAQIPQKMSYQAIIRDASNNPVVNQEIGMRLTIQDAVPTPIYVETHSTTTDENGIATVEVGTGTPVTGTLAGVNWGAGVYTIKTETDPTTLGGTTYTITGTSSIQSVPYALYVKKVGDTNFNGDYNTLINKPTFDGTETKVTSGTRITVTGTGSAATPYVVNANPLVSGYSHYLGEDVGYGIIFYIYAGNDGLERVLIASYTESDQFLQTPTSTTNGTRTWDGVYNTTLYTNSPAKTYVKSLVEGGGGWYIPSQDELCIMYQNRFHLNKGLYDHNVAFPGTATLLSDTEEYWSSTEIESTNGAWKFDFIAATFAFEAKANNHMIRAIRGLLIIPTLTTTAASSVTSYTATTGGNISSDGGASVTARGVCYNTTGNPYITDIKTSDGTGAGAFISNLTGLTPGTTYYVKAHATNSEGTNYGNIINFTAPPVVPALTTTAISSIKSTSAESGGNITYDGGAAVTARGVCWNTTGSPTTANSKTSNGTGTGSFASPFTGLTLGVTYYVRAYATNSAGTAYGNEVIFTTASTIPTLTTTDVNYTNATQASSGGNITSDDGSPVTARGICWSTSPNPTIALPTKTTNGIGIGSFASTLTGLSVCTRYYVRAYATNGAGTAYGNEIIYNHITIGSDCLALLGGRVAYIFQPGDPGYVIGEQHGLIIPTVDQSTSGTRYMNVFNESFATGVALGTGVSNTNLIMDADLATTAAKLCFNLVLNGFDDWYLPSKDELEKLYINNVPYSLGIFAGNYWSSTEIDDMYATNLSFSTGTFSSPAKTNLFQRVRAVRTF